MGAVRKGFLVAQHDGRFRSLWGGGELHRWICLVKARVASFSSLIEGFSITYLGHIALVPSVVLFFVPVPAFLVGMVLPGSPVAACFRSAIARFDMCKSVAIWAIETPSFNIVI